MFWGLFNWIYSFFYAPLLITESPKSYLDRIFANSEGKHILRYSEGYLYFDVLPINYECEYFVSRDMSNYIIDNSIAKIEILFYHEEPEWPKFIRGAPCQFWTDPFLIFLSELL